MGIERGYASVKPLLFFSHNKKSLFDENLLIRLKHMDNTLAQINDNVVTLTKNINELNKNKRGKKSCQ